LCKKDYKTEEARAQQRALESLMNKKMNARSENIILDSEGFLQNKQRERR
jgi:hypothetical protein